MPTLQEIVAQSGGQSIGSHNISQIAAGASSSPASPTPPVSTPPPPSSQGTNSWLNEHVDSSGKLDVASAGAAYQTAKTQSERPSPLSQTTLPMASSFQAGQDAAKASDVELWSTIRGGAPGFSGSGVSGDTFHQAVEEMSKRQTQASFERQRTGQIDTSVDSSRGAMIEAGVVGPKQWLPSNVDKSAVEAWRAREQEEISEIPIASTPSGNVYYKPPAYKTEEEWSESLMALTPEQLEQSDKREIPVDMNVYGTELALGDSENVTSEFEETGLAGLEGIGESGVIGDETEYSEYPVQEDVSPEFYDYELDYIAPQGEAAGRLETPPSIVSSIFNTNSLNKITGVNSLPDEGDIWEVAVGGPRTNSIRPTVIPGQVGYFGVGVKTIAV